ncbi:hypothetical protein Tco_0620468 [Tanacetum coccineum]
MNEDLPKDNPKLEIAFFRYELEMDMYMGIMPTRLANTLETIHNKVLVIDVQDPSDAMHNLPAYAVFSSQKLVSFVTEIHTLSIDISL